MNNKLLALAVSVALIGSLSLSSKSFADTNSSSALFGSDAITTGDISNSGNYTDSSDNALNAHDFGNNNNESTNVDAWIGVGNDNSTGILSESYDLSLDHSFNTDITGSVVGNGNASFTNVGAGINGGAEGANVSSSQNALVTGVNENLNVNSH